MTKYRHSLPQLSDHLFLTDGGIETSLIFLDGFELPSFAAFDLLERENGLAGLRDYYVRYTTIAKRLGVGFILESPTWRANLAWANTLGYSAAQLTRANQQAIDLMVALRQDFETDLSPMVVSGCIGPRGDGYDPCAKMTADEAADYHAFQAEIFAERGADMVTAITMNYVEEAIGVVRAAAAVGMPSAISFTLETDGHLPTGQPLAETIDQIDDETGEAPAYYMINCAHPTHFDHILEAGEHWHHRVRGLRANASKCSHAELDEASELDMGDPTELAEQYSLLRQRLRNLNVLGGCCGTDHRHIEHIAAACAVVDA